MKKLFFAVLTGLCLHTTAQQMPLYSQMYFLRMLYNPALTGYNGTSNVYGFYREQWTAMPGHPVTRGGVADFSLWQDRIGTGLHVYNDNTDIIHRVSAQLYYAQKIHLAKDHLLSLGVAAGLLEAHVDFNNAIVADQNDPHILDAGKGATAFDLNVGLAYQWKKLTIGFSIPSVINTHATILDKTQSTNFGNQRTFIGSASYEISIKNETWNVEPSVLVKNQGKVTQVDANVMANYKRIAYLGIGYRMNYGMSAMAAVTIGQLVTLGYAYELPMMSGAQYSDTKGTHEVLIGVHLTKFMKKKESEPKLDLIDSLMEKQAQLRHDVDSAQRTADSALHRIDSTQNELDTLKNWQSQQGAKSVIEQKQEKMENDSKLNEYEQKLNEHDQLLRDMRQRMDSVKNSLLDSLDNLLKEYRKRISEKPAVNFPDKVDKTTKATPGDVYRLNKVEFNTNSSYLKKESYPELDKVVDFLNMNPDTKIRVSGHTDYLASDEYNQWLSDRRAKRVYDYLADKGVNQNRMSYIGFGKRAPIADNNTEEGRALNRRVELEIIK